MFRYILFAMVFVLTSALQVNGQESVIGTWRSTGDYGFVLRIDAGGTAIHYDLDYGTGTRSNAQTVTWRVDATTTDPVVYKLDNPRLDRKGSRMYRDAKSGNLSIRGNTDGEIWVLVPTK